MSSTLRSSPLASRNPRSLIAVVVMSLAFCVVAWAAVIVAAVTLL